MILLWLVIIIMAIISLCFINLRSTTLQRNISLLKWIEVLCQPYQGHVIGLSSTRCEDDFLGIRVDQVGDVASGLLHGIFRLSTILMRLGMRVPKCFSQIWHHSITDSEVNRGCGLEIHIDRP